MGAYFTATGTFNLLPGGGFEYAGFEYSGLEGRRYVRKIAFPEVTVPRTDDTAVFRPLYVGEVVRPDWANAKPKKSVSAVGPAALAYRGRAALNGDGRSHCFDQRGEARRTLCGCSSVICCVIIL